MKINITTHPLSTGFTWLQQAWRIYKANFVMWTILSFMQFLLVSVVKSVPFVGFLFGLCARFYIDTSLIRAMELQVQTARKPKMEDLFYAVKPHGKIVFYFALLEWGLSMLAVLPMIGAGIWVLITLFGDAYVKLLQGNTQVLHRLFEVDPQQLQLSMIVIVIALMVSLTIAACIWMAMVFVPYFICFYKEYDIRTMVKSSFHSCSKNVWSLTALCTIWLLLILLGVVTLGLGFLVVGPLIHISIYTAANDIFPIDLDQRRNLLVVDESIHQKD